MRRLAVTWQLSSFLIAAALYFVFVLPRWWELLGSWSHGAGTAARIVTGLLLGATALPVVLTLVKTRKPEFGTPQLALTLRVWSIIGHVSAGALIVATALAEIWLDVDTFGRGLFAVYGAAAAIALLSAAAFYLAFAAELPPPPPKPLKPKRNRGRQRTGKDTAAVPGSAASAGSAEAAESDAAGTDSDDGDAEDAPDPDDEATGEPIAAEADPESGDATGEPPQADDTAEAAEAKPARATLRNRRPRKRSGVGPSPR